MQAQEKNSSSGTVLSLLSIHKIVDIPPKDKMKIVNFKMKESEIEAFDLYCAANGIKNKSELIRALICNLIK
ncbi:MAG: ribbon-helix-helix domain-containing protein [Clostridia bacterium]|nr:ribbon-helix-helix domain-containing protein [Clostridia bacterium]